MRHSYSSSEGLLFGPVTDVVCGVGGSVFTEGEDIVAVGVVFSGVDENVFAAPRVRWNFFQKSLPIFRNRGRVGLLDERFQPLRGGWGKPILRFVNHQLGFESSDVGFDFRVFCDPEVVAHHVNGRCGQEADDCDNHHDFQERESGAGCADEHGYALMGRDAGEGGFHEVYSGVRG